ncbi:MAG: acetyl-CoA C-acetyltransferase [Candidatus Thermoplasmatota archaeon]|jgi:acetyl-CoA C-acetyltransferase|nr:acetyl-CoA C-acetyltransferase [Candidatus Thermoplasmatota archaeon]MCL5789085.1 acetyl-CoA C-acetyltransferase [Candidatus Thermoplasmatota archaeon]
MSGKESDVYLVYYKRTAFSKSKPSDPSKDIFNSIRMDEALAELMKDSVKATGVKPKDIDDVILGSALQVGENWMYGGRQPLLLAGFPVEVPAMAIDRACSSSLNAISVGSMEIMTGNSGIVLAGGMEHMTHVPLGDNPMVSPNLKLLLRPEYIKYDMKTGFYMGLTAEKLAKLKGIQREEMDQFAYESHTLASRALEEGYFRDEILPLEVEVDGGTRAIDKDQSIRKDSSIEQMRKLPPAFKEGGVITAGNSSPLNAGASLVMLASGKKVNEYGLKPLAKITSFGWAAVDPSIMGEGPVPASKKALANAGLKADDIDLWEINEAFAVVVLNAMKELNIPRNKVNVNGGAIAIGHPLGASGARLAGTLSRLLRKNGKERGMATLCVGGGQGYSAILERV